MNVTLYYVEGISRIDTPYFATKTSQASLIKQQEFFDSHKVKTIELSYYPPHYRNTIKFETDDLGFKTQVNYLSLDYDDKTYYYFIDSVNYVSESIIEVDITMDVIQTYMFNIYIANGIIERKFINRFDGSDNINRSYIRENISRNEYVYHSSHIVNEDTKEWLVFITTTRYWDTAYVSTIINYNHPLPGAKQTDKYISSYPFYILPYYEDTKCPANFFYTESGPGSFTKTTGYIEPTVNIIRCFSDLSTRNWVNDIYICPFNSADGIFFEQLIGQYNIRFVNTPSYYFLSQHNIGGSSLPFNLITIGDGTHDPQDYDGNVEYNRYVSNVCSYYCEVSQVVKVSSLSMPFNSAYITQMFDENYIRFKFGSLTAFTTIPLYNLVDKHVYCNYSFNPTDGTRTYWISKANDYVDTYNTVIQDTNILHLDLKNDPWVEYVSQNRSRYVAAGLNTAVDIFTKGMASSLNAKFAEDEITDIRSNPANYDKRYKEPKLKNKPNKMVNSLGQNILSAGFGTGVSAIGSAVSNFGSQALKDVNVSCQPPTPKQIANTSSICAKQAYIMTYIERCQDYEQCAQYYHRNGFLVNEYINAKADIFSYVFNRYYFNVLKMSIPNVHLHGVIEDEDTIQSITDRLVDGVRLWNVNNTGVVIGDFQYDNVELSYLN